MKKLLTVLLAVFMLASLLSIPAAADGGIAFNVSTVSGAKAGDEVTVTVSITSNPGAAGITMGISYDDTRLEKVSFDGAGLSWTIGAGAVWVDSQNSTYTGDILYLKFKVKEGAKPGLAAVSVSPTVGNIDEEAVAVSVTPGGVNVVCEHSWNSGEVTTKPSCTVEGVKTYTCTKCSETKTEPIPKLAHTTELKNYKPATCKETGYTGDFVCTVCDQVITAGTVIPMVEHSWDDGKVTTAPTCTEKGVKTYTCTVCKETKTEEIPALGHKWDDGKVTTKPTCTEKGVKTYTCTVCKETRTEKIPALGHKWDDGKVTTKPSCTEKGVKTYTCTVCEETKTEEIPALGHTWDNGKVQKAPTNTETGEMLYTCKVCDATKIEAIPVVAADSKPKTGDEGAIWLWALALLASGSAATLILKKKKN